jgi:hypothetical protein
VIRYLTGCTTGISADVAREYGIGLMIQPGNSTHLRVASFPFWAADNGAFTKSKNGFSAEAFRKMLAHAHVRAQASTCLFVVAPDKLAVLPNGVVVGDARGTLEQFPGWSREIRAAGFPAALVAQNGLESMLAEVPWELVDVLFIGGDDDWKLSDAARVCIAEARLHGKKAHMGRVNSLVRFKKACSMLCDTVDGTFIAFGPKKNLPQLISWIGCVKRGVQAHLPWRIQ